MTVTAILSACLWLTYIPTSWKSALFVLLRKPGKPRSDVTSYRPISLLPELSKIWEMLVSKLMNYHLLVQNIIIPEQYGFRRHHSTNHQLFRLTHSVRHHHNINKHTGLVCLDLKQSFDKVWHRGLVYKLHQIGLPTNIVKFITIYLKHRSFVVRLGSLLSGSMDVPAGVPLGSVLEPKLFTLFINDISRHPDTELALFE